MKKYKVLFVSRFKNGSGVSVIVKNQGESLKKQGVEVEYFLIRGKGAFAYIRAVLKLRKKLSTDKFDLVHAHYSFSAITAAFSTKLPVVASLMGSDLNRRKINFLISWLFKFFWDSIIVKSEKLKFKSKNSYVIPNGVDLNQFQPSKDKGTLFANNYLNILFAANPYVKIKNVQLAKEAIGLIASPNVELHYLGSIDNSKMVHYYNSSNLILLTSLHEGSPNVIKEAMACNCPIVSTDVGDVKDLIGNTKGCYICSYEPEDVAEKIKLAIEFSLKTGGTNGRQRIVELGLDSATVAKRIVCVYENVLSKKLNRKQ